MQPIGVYFGLFCVAFGLEPPVLAIGYSRPTPDVRRRLKTSPSRACAHWLEVRREL